jgi:hypothetical protein
MFRPWIRAHQMDRNVGADLTKTHKSLKPNDSTSARMRKVKLRDRYGLEPMIPDALARDLVHRVIFEELCQGVVRPESKSAYLAVIDDLRRDGADGIILGYTEIGMLIGQQDTALPLFDTTQIHAAYIMDFAFGGSFADQKPTSTRSERVASTRPARRPA